MPIYQLLQIKDPNSNGVQQLLEDINKNGRPLLADRGARHYGLFLGLFGLATNELYWVSQLENPDHGPAMQVLEAGFTIVNQINLVPTVRPTRYSPPDKEGLYVFRWFDVLNRDVDEIASISEQAWVYFEAGFDTEIQGFFAEADGSADQGKMVLLTWYKNLSVWEASRVPALEATKLFVKRHRLTLGALPIATRLVKQGK